MQSIPGPSPAGLMTVFYCLRFETPPTWRVKSPCLYPPGTGWPSYTPRRWVHFSSPPTTRRATVEVFDPHLAGSFYKTTRFYIAKDNILHSDCCENIKHRKYCIASTISVTIFTWRFFSNDDLIGKNIS
jgi:hypothetical protein